MALQLVLASNSPARAKLLTDAGFEFIVDPAHLDEESFTAKTHELLVQLLSKEKAACVSLRHLNALIIAADTLVICENEIFGKPSDAAHSIRTLKVLQGKTHQVLTGLCVMNTNSGDYCVGYESTNVTFKSLSDEAITAYVATQEPVGKAGSYAIQGIARNLLIENITGDETNVVGLPLNLLSNFLAKLQD